MGDYVLDGFLLCIIFILSILLVRSYILLRYERCLSQERLVFLQQGQDHLSKTFSVLSFEALQTNNQAFLTLAQTVLEKHAESAKVDLSQRQKAISDLVTPVQASLSQMDQKIQGLEKAREGAYQALRQQITDLILSQNDLRAQTTNLVRALSTPSTRGQWGEMQLRRAVEMAGMVSHCDFIEQYHTENEQGRLRPDMIIKLPGNKTIVVDAKVPLNAYLEAHETTNDETKSKRLFDHAKQVRSHIRQLSQRKYFDQFPNSPEFVVLFLPGEHFFSAALEKDPTLIEVGVQEKVILATPTTLIALLRSVAYGWRQEQIAENARAISDLGQELYKRLSDLGDHFNKLGRHLGQTVEMYNQAVGTLEKRVLVSAKKFNHLDNSLSPIDGLKTLENEPRCLTSEEFIKKEPPHAA